jgi:predicted nucleotidyltransferase
MAETNQIKRFQSILRAEFPRLAERYSVTSLGLFGSTVRGEAHAASDLDILVRFEHAPGLLRFIELENYLGDLLGVPVDLVMADALKSHIGARILAEVVPV